MNCILLNIGSYLKSYLWVAGLGEEGRQAEKYYCFGTNPYFHGST